MYLIVVCTLINFTLQNLSQNMSVHINRINLSLESVFGTLFAIVFLDEIITLNFVIGNYFYYVWNNFYSNV